MPIWRHKFKNMNNQVTTQKPIKTLINAEITREKFKEVLGNKAPAFMASLLSLINGNTNFETVDPQTVLSAAMTAATLDLPINPNLGFAYIIPYAGKAQFQMGYKGFVQLAMRSGQFRTLNVSDVRIGEISDNNRLTGEMKFQWAENRESLAVIGYVGYMRLTNGFEKMMYMTTEELKTHGGKYSQSAKKGYGLWKDEFDAMAKKTVIKLLLSKYAPLTTEMQTAQLADQAVISDEGKYDYIDNDGKEETPKFATDNQKEQIKKLMKYDEKSEDEKISLDDWLSSMEYEEAVKQVQGLIMEVGGKKKK
jgi:recombination protein RecT